MLYHGDCAFELRLHQPSESVDLIVTSPPYAEQRRGGIHVDKYHRWFLERAEQFYRVLKPTGSFVLNLWPHTERTGQFRGQESCYVMDCITALRQEGWALIDTYCWRKTNGAPQGKPINKFRSAWEPIYHLAKQTDIKFFPEAVMRPAKSATLKRAQRLDKSNPSATGSGFRTNMGHDFIRQQQRRYSKNGSPMNFIDENCLGPLVYPDNVIECACENRNVGHHSAFPEPIPEFFIKLFTRRGDTVLDPFCGSSTTGVVAERLNRHYIGIDKDENFIESSRQRLREQDEERSRQRQAQQSEAARLQLLRQKCP